MSHLRREFRFQLTEVPNDLNYSPPTVCQLYGHLFQEEGGVRFCPLCGEQYTDKGE